jgi:hypothetical protein
MPELSAKYIQTLAIKDKDIKEYLPDLSEK